MNLRGHHQVMFVSVIDEKIMRSDDCEEARLPRGFKKDRAWHTNLLVDLSKSPALCTHKAGRNSVL